MNSNSMEHVPKQHLSLNSRMGNSPSEVFLKILRSVVSRSCFEQWQINNLISWKFLFKNSYVNPKSNSRITLTRSWIRWRKFNQVSAWQKINFKCTFCGFSFTPMSKCRKRPWNLYKYKNSFLKTYFSLIIEYGMYLKCLQKPRCLGWFKTSQALQSAV